MIEPPRTLQVGAASVSIINIGDIQGPLTDWMDEPTGGWPPPLRMRLIRVERFPTNCVYIAAPGLSVLMDAGAYKMPAPPSSAISAYQPPPTLLAQLSALGVRPTEVNH